MADNPPDGIPQFQLPADYDSVSNWFWGDVAPIVGNWQQEAISGPLHPTYRSDFSGFGGSTASGMFGSDGGVYKIGHYSGPLRAYSFLSQLDQNIAEWGDWLATDPRSSLQSAIQAAQVNPAFDVNNVYGDTTMLTGGLSSLFTQEAIRQKLGALGIPDAGIQQVIEGLYDPWTAPQGATGAFQNNPNLYIPSASPDSNLAGFAKLFTDAGLNLGAPMGSQVTNYAGANVNNIEDAALLSALQAAGITPAAPAPIDGTTTQPVATGTPLPATFNTQEAAMADNASGVSPTALNPWASFIYSLAGKNLKGFDAKGNPVFETATTPGILGDQQKADIAEYLKPLGLNATEQYGRGLLDSTSLNNNLNRALGVFDNTVIPGMTDLATDGFRTPTPDLYGGDQYAKARGAMNGRLYDPYQEQAAQGFLNDPLYAPFQQNAATGLLNNDVFRNQAKGLVSEMMSKGVPQATRDAAYRDFNQHAGQDLRASLGGQTGSFSTDYLGALARGSADITNQLARESAAYQAQGLGISNQMDTAQRGAEETALGILNQMSQGTREAQSQGLQLLNQMDASERDAMMQALGVTNTMTQTQGALDSSLNESAAARRASGLPMLASTTTSRAQLPLTFGQDVINAGAANRLTDESLRPGSRTLNTLLQLTGGSAPGNLGYVAQGQLPSATTSLASGLAPFSAAFGQQQGGGSFLGSLLGNANFQNLAGGLLSSAASGLGNLFSSGFSSLFGGGGSAQTNTGASYGNPSQPTYMYPNNGGSSWTGLDWL